MEIKEIKKLEKNFPKYYCEVCDFKCFQKCDWVKHVGRAKHQKNSQGNVKEIKKLEKTFFCQCGKNFQSNAGLWKHKKKCQQKSCKGTEYSEENKENENNEEKYETDNSNISAPPQLTPELVVMLLQQNKDMQNMLMEFAKNGINNTTNTNSHNTTNSHNKTFNLHIFLNETCKDAMNIMDFVDQIVLNLNDLEETGRLGFAEGISKMIMKRLQKLDITQRPIHCSDPKRETLYIKDENRWEKEGDDKPKLTKAVKEIAGKNMMQIFDWQKAHPDYNDPESRINDKYMKMVINAMSGGTEEETNENYEKIIKNITKEAIIDKDKFMV